MSGGRIVSILVLAVLVLASVPALVRPESVSAAVWQTQVVDGGYDVGRMASIVLDSSDNPRIAYHDFYASTLKYAVYDGSGWQTQTIASGGYGMGRGNSLVLDSSGNPHVSFVERWGWNVWHTYWNGSAWQQELVYPGGGVGFGTSLALNSLGHPSISFSNLDNGLKYAHWDGSSWQTDAVYDGNTGWFTSLAFDTSDDPHISYYSFAGELRYASWNGSGWSSEAVDSVPGGSVGQYNSLALDSSGNPHIAYSCTDSPEGGLKYAYRDISGWHTEVVDTTPDCASGGGSGSAVSLKLDSSGNPHISYGCNTENGAILRYAHLDNSGWHTEIAGSGTDNSLALDTSGTPHIAYYEGPGSATKSLVYAIGTTPPSQPGNMSPTNGEAGVSLTPTLQTSAFSDPDAGDTHAASEWQITTTSSDYSSPLFDSGTDAANLTSINIPVGTLAYDTSYYWHARYRDGRGWWSGWSAETSFVTASRYPRWDINQDSMVDYKDLAVLGAFYGTAIGDPRFYPYADINQDGKVDYKDLAMLGAHYGEVY